MLSSHPDYEETEFTETAECVECEADVEFEYLVSGVHPQRKYYSRICPRCGREEQGRWDALAGEPL